MNHPTRTSKGSARIRLTMSPIVAHVDTPCRPSQDVSTDPAALWDSSKRILFHVAKKVRQTVRLQLNGHGRGEAEAEELVHDAFLCVVEALPRFNPAAGEADDLRVWPGTPPQVAGGTGRLLRSVARTTAPHGHGQEKAALLSRRAYSWRYGSWAGRRQREGIHTQGRCHPAAFAGPGSVSDYPVLARGRQLFGSSPSPGS